MSRFDLLYDAKNALERAVDLDDLVAALFADHPDLQSFMVEVTNEYDDNNYSDYSRVTKINGYSVDYEGEYEDEFTEPECPESEKASAAAINDVMSITDEVQEKHGHGDHEFNRGDYQSHVTKVLDSSDMICAVSILKGDKVPVSILRDACSRWVLHHAEAHGRYSPEDEFDLFAREDMIDVAREYAERHGPLSDKTLNYFILSLKSEDPEYEQLQKYLGWLKEPA
jgi:hypothetical protein